MKAAAHFTTPEQYIASLPPERRTAVQTLHEAICRTAPELAPSLAHRFLSYGTYHYKYASGREGDWFIVGLASQKQHLSLYLSAAEPDGYLAEQNRQRLGKVSVGRSCVRFKKLEDLNLPVAMELVARAAALQNQPGAFAM
jgi:uncharacterized protein YdhG (YjbR/CyaY superfamily)